MTDTKEYSKSLLSIKDHVCLSFTNMEVTMQCCCISSEWEPSKWCPNWNGKTVKGNHVCHMDATGSSRSCSAFCASASCIRIRLLTAAAPACHGNSFADIYWSRTQAVHSITYISDSRPAPASPRPQAAFSGEPWWPPPATLVRTPGSINPNAYEANLSRWDGFRQQGLLNSELFVVAPRSTSPSLLIHGV